MTQEEIAIMADMLGSAYRPTSNWVMVSCPNARVSMEHKGNDSRPSFGVKIEAFKKSMCHCFTCGIKGPIEWILYRLVGSGAVDPDVYTYVLKVENASAGVLISRLKEREQSHLLPMEDRKNQLRVCLKNAIDYSNILVEFLQHRGILRIEKDFYGLTYSPEHNRIIFPIKDRKGETVGAVGRAVLQNQQPKYYKFDGSSKDVLFGEHTLDPDVSPELILVEGPIDQIMTNRQFPNVLSIGGTALSDRQIQRLSDWCKYVTIILDGDEAGRAGIKKIGNLFKKRMIRTYFVPLPEGYDPDSMGVNLKKYYDLYKKFF